MRGITLILTFSHQGRRGYYQAIAGCEFLYSSLDNAPGFLNTLPEIAQRLQDRRGVEAWDASCFPKSSRGVSEGSMDLIRAK